MKAIKDLKTNYYVFFIMMLVFNMIVVGSIVYFLVSKDRSSQFKELAADVGFYLTLSCTIFGESFLFHALVTFLRDLRSVLRNDFQTIHGTVIKYAANKDETGEQINNYPIIKETNTGKTKTLCVNAGTKLNGTYTIIYLKHTKMGVVEKSHQNWE